MLSYKIWQVYLLEPDNDFTSFIKKDKTFSKKIDIVLKLNKNDSIVDYQESWSHLRYYLLKKNVMKGF